MEDEMADQKAILDEILTAAAVEHLGEDASLDLITAWVTLRSAAPDLLAALESVFYHFDSPEIRNLECWKLTRAAIVKARQGETGQ